MRLFVVFQFLQKRVAEALGLGLADAGDLQQLLDGARASGRHVEQRRVGADDVGRDVLLLRKAQPQRLERGEQVVLRLFGPFGLGFGPAPGRLVLQGLALDGDLDPLAVEKDLGRLRRGVDAAVDRVGLQIAARLQQLEKLADALKAEPGRQPTGLPRSTWPRSAVPTQ